MNQSSRWHRNDWTDTDVARHWDSVASIYIDANDRVHGTHVQRFKKSVQYLKLDAHCRVLNITSRDCEADEYIRCACPTAQVVNAEISQGLIAVASNIRPQAKQVKIDTYSKLSFLDGQFDRVLSLETLEHVAEPIKFLRELYRVSTNKAVMVLSCPPATCELSYRVYTRLFGGHGEGPHRFLASKEVKKMFQKTGWKLLLHEGTLLVPIGPRFLRELGEKIIKRCQNTLISELGIRQFYVCRKS